MTLPRTSNDYEQVKAAAAVLLSAGVTPTAERIADQLGWHDPAPAEALLTRWQQDLRQAPHLALPDTVPAAVASALTAVWEAALREAGSGFAALREAADSEIADATAHRVEALAALRQERARADALEEQLERLRQTTAELQQRLAAGEEKLAAATAAASEQRQRHEQECRAAADSAHTLREQITALQDELRAQERQACARLSEQTALARHGEQQLRQTERQLQTLRQQHRTAHDQLAERAVVVKELQRERKTLAVERDGLSYRVEQQSQQLGRLSAERDAGRERLAQLQRETRRLNTELDEVKQRGHQTDLERAQLQREVALLRERLQRLFDSEQSANAATLADAEIPHTQH